MKKIVLMIGLLALLVLSACSPAGETANNSQVANEPASQNAAPVQQNVPAASPRTINVSGTGQVTLAPDIAYINIGVQTLSANVSEALQQNNASAQAITASLVELGIDPKDIQTSSFNIYPQPQYSPSGEITSTSYNVNNTVYVTVRDLQILGSLLDVVVRSGANSINGITFDVADKAAALSEARRLAIDSARQQAEEMAAASGVGLGELYNLTAYTSSNPMPMYEGRGMAMDASQVPLSAGQLIIRVEVSAAYYIQ